MDYEMAIWCNQQEHRDSDSCIPQEPWQQSNSPVRVSLQQAMSNNNKVSYSNNQLLERTRNANMSSATELS